MSRLIIVIFSIFSFESWSFCFESAGEYYDVNPKILKAIAIVESDLNPIAVNKNENSLGLMQIHPQWFLRLAKFNISPEQLLSDPCVNVNVGAWILASNFSTHGKNWNSIGAYNAGFSKKKHVENNRHIYIKKVRKALNKIQFNTIQYKQ